MLNYAGCCKCQSRAFLGEEGRVRSVTGGDVEVGEEDSGNEVTLGLRDSSSSQTCAELSRSVLPAILSTLPHYTAER